MTRLSRDRLVQERGIGALAERIVYPHFFGPGTLLHGGALPVVLAEIWVRPPGMQRRLAPVLAISLAVPSPSQAAALAPANLDREIEALVEQRRFREAAVRLEDELKQLPEMHDTRVRRNELASRAVSMHIEDFRMAPDCGLAGAGLLVADEYMQEMLSVYGPGARHSDEYVGMSELRKELGSAHAEFGCSPPQSSPSASAPMPGPEPAPALSPPRSEDRGAKRSDGPLIVGLVVSASLAGAMLAVSLGTTLPRAREPFQGVAYKKIHDAAVRSSNDTDFKNDVGHGSHSDMCSEMNRSKNVEVAAACADWRRLEAVAIGTGIAAGVLGVTTVALAGVLASKRRKTPGAMALLRRHHATLGVVPGWRGMSMSMGFRF